MKALGFEQHGGLEKIRLLTLPDPEPGPGEVRVAIRAAGFNHLDLFTLEGIPGIPIPLPHVLGGDGAGVVDRVGAGVEPSLVGQKVMVDPSLADGTCEYCRKGLENFCTNYRIVGEHTNGTAAEYLVIPRVNVVPLPPRLGFEEAAGVALVFMTAWHALRTVGEVREGDRVAIMGAGGGLVTAAQQVARHFGAHTVVVTRSNEKAAKARSLGADEVIVYDDPQKLSKVLWEASGKRGFDVLFDSTGKATFGASTRALSRGGRLVFCGATTGPMVEIDLRGLFWRGASLRGSTMATRAEFREVYRLLSEGKFRPVIDRVFPLDEGKAALQRFQEGDVFGKVLVRVGQ